MLHIAKKWGYLNVVPEFSFPKVPAPPFRLSSTYPPAGQGFILASPMGILSINFPLDASQRNTS